MNSDAMLTWMENEWMNLPLVQENHKKQETDIEDVAPWNRGRV